MVLRDTAPLKIIIARTDNIGDVIVTLPMAGIIKSHFPHSIIYFIGKEYTQSVIDHSGSVDVFVSKEQLMKPGKVGALEGADYILYVFPDKELEKRLFGYKIKNRIGTSHRWYHWLYCNRLINFSRKKSDRHEAELNLNLLRGMGLNIELGTYELVPYLNFKAPDPPIQYLAPNTIILHPKSKGSAREWPVAYYRKLSLLLVESGYEVAVTGTLSEGEKIKQEAPGWLESEGVHDLTGKLSLKELIGYIAQSKALVACSTGPLHIAAFAGIWAVGIYPPIKPMHPGRWAPVGERVRVFCKEIDCTLCKTNGLCTCIASVTPEEVHLWIRTTLPLSK